MALPVKPQKKTAYGKRRIWLVDTIANPAAPTVAEINAGVYVTCFGLSDQAGPTSTPSKVTLPVLLCETEAEEDFGTTAHAHPDMTLLYDPQAATGHANKTAWDAVVDGFEGFIVWELGISAEESDAVTAADKVTVVPAKARVVSEEPTAMGEGGLFAFQTAVVVRAPYIQRNVAVVTGT